MIKKTIPYMILGIFLTLGVFGVFLIITGFSPEDITSLNINNNQVGLIPSGETITLLTYNMGHGGLDNERDSYDAGGNDTRARSEDDVEENLEFMIETIDDVNPDMFLLQEVDTDSRRSYYLDQMSILSEKYPNYSNIYGKNKVIRWKLSPIHKPVGKIESGLATFSKFNTIESLRYSLPYSGGFLSNLFDYQWAITKTAYETETSGDLVVINVKLAPFNEDDNIREEQLDFLKLILEDEYEKGNHVIAGGDFSHNLPGTDPYSFRHTEEWPSWLKNIPDDFEVDDFNWQVDEDVPTFRTLSSSYRKGRNFVAVTDGFIVSDNIQVEEVSGINDEFQGSNHNPVYIQFRLKP